MVVFFTGTAADMAVSNQRLMQSFGATSVNQTLIEIVETLVEERRIEQIGLIQLRAGRSMIDLVPSEGASPEWRIYDSRHRRASSRRAGSES